MQTLSTALQNAINAGNPQRVLLKFGNSEFSNESIVMSKGVELSEEFCGSKDFEIGTAPSSIISFTLINDNGQFADFEFGWFTAYLGARIDSGLPTEIIRYFNEGGSNKAYAFAPIGTFYAHRPDVVSKKTIAITAYDQMTKFDIDMPSNIVQYPSTIGDIFSAMCTQVGVTPKSDTFLNSDLEVESEPEEFESVTMRTVLGWIAECACANARFDRDGTLEMSWFTSTGKSYSESNYKDFDYAWYETQAIDSVCFRNTDENNDTTSGSGSNSYLIQDNPFLNE